MSLTEKIDADIIAAMKSRDKISLEAVRAVKTAFILARAEKGIGSVLTDDEELKIISKLVKQRKESAEIYREKNRPDLYEKEEGEAAVLEKYLPSKMTETELKAAIEAIIASTGAKAMSDMGKVMGAATKELAGRADGKEISAIVRQLLS